MHTPGICRHTPTGHPHIGPKTLLLLGSRTQGMNSRRRWSWTEGTSYSYTHASCISPHTGWFLSSHRRIPAYFCTCAFYIWKIPDTTTHSEVKKHRKQKTKTERIFFSMWPGMLTYQIWRQSKWAKMRKKKEKGLRVPAPGPISQGLPAAKTCCSVSQVSNLLRNSNSSVYVCPATGNHKGSMCSKHVAGHVLISKKN